MKVYLLGSVVAFGLTIIMVLIQETLLLSLSRMERLHYEYYGGGFGGRIILKDALANAVLSWVGVVIILLSSMMLAIGVVVIKR